MFTQKYAIVTSALQYAKIRVGVGGQANFGNDKILKAPLVATPPFYSWQPPSEGISC